jgi:seryl-tRNA(Sec) selenium transferase
MLLIWQLSCLLAGTHLVNVQTAIQKLTDDLKQTLNLKATIYWNVSHHGKQKRRA